MSRTIKTLAITTMVASALITGCANNPNGLGTSMKNAVNGIANGQSPEAIAKEEARKAAVDSINNNVQ